MAKTKNNKKSRGFADKIHAKNTKEKLKKKLNPFEVHINKEKFKVLGKKSKNDRGLPGVSRAKAIQKRKNTIGFELKLMNKSNTFIDKRIGEKNKGLTEEEKLIARFAAEKIQQHKSKTSKQSIYNLADDEILTHKGQTLEEIEKFDDPRSDDEEEDLERNKFGHLRNDFVDVNFGGGVLSRSDSTDGAKSRKDVIEQLIADSKKRKLEKQKLKEETLDLTEKLDTEWKDLHPVVSVNFNKDTESSDKTPSLIDKLLTEHEKKNQDYDKTMRLLKFEPRGTPSNRLKSEDEIAKIEKDKLEQLEKDRLARMKGIVPSSNPSTRKYKSADDLDDAYEVDPDPQVMIAYDSEGKLLVPLRDETSGDKNDSNDNDSDDEDEGEQSNEELDGSDSDDSLNDLREMSGSEKDNEDDESLKNDAEKEEPPQKKHVTFKLNGSNARELKSSGEIKPILKSSSGITKNGNKSSVKEVDKRVELKSTETIVDAKEETIVEDVAIRKQMMEKAAKELPYTYEMPKSYETLWELLQNQSPEHQYVIIERIIKCNHPSLRAENKEKMNDLFEFLLQFLNDLFSEDNLCESDSVQTAFKTFDRLMGHYYLLAQMNPANANRSFAEVIKEKYEDFKSKKAYPGMDTLIFFKLASVLFSTSDLRHPSVTPCFHFISEILNTAKVKSSTDIARGLFLVLTFLECTSLSKRFMPSILNFVRGVLYIALPNQDDRVRAEVKVIAPFKPNNELLVMKSNFNRTLTCDKMLPECLIGEDDTDEFRVRTLVCALRILEALYDRIGDYRLRRALLEPHLKIVNYLPLSCYPSYVIKLLNQVKNKLGDVSQTKALKPLIEENVKPKMLRLYEPAIENEFSGKKKKVMSKEKGEHQRLVYKLKKETKGALREIRRDKTYINSVKVQERIRSDNIRKEKVKRIFSEASLQQGELNALQRSKKKKK